MNLRRFLLISSQDSFARTLVPQALPHDDEVRLTASVFDAFALLRAAKFDAVLVDMAENDEDAAVLCRMVRRLSNVPIVMLSTMGTREDVIRGYRMGADAHIEIPCDPRVLRARLQALLRPKSSKVQAALA
jgi:DNA-binding response OmpR family regulator